jgi:hypothetical protein
MKAHEEVREKKEVNAVKEHERNIAAFFDLDGTLMALPSLERRFFRMLRYRREIPAKNYFLWLREALRLLPRGISTVLHANKMYLRGVHILDERGERDGDISSSHKSGHQDEGQASAPPPKRARRNPRLPVPAFFAQAVERVTWHARQGHEIVLVSGTLEPLGREAARHRSPAWRPRNHGDDSLDCNEAGTNGRQVDGKSLGRRDVWEGESSCGEATG